MVVVYFECILHDDGSFVQTHAIVAFLSTCLWCQYVALHSACNY